MSNLIEVLRKSLKNDNPTQGEIDLERAIMREVLDNLEAPTDRKPVAADVKSPDVRNCIRLLRFDRNVITYDQDVEYAKRLIEAIPGWSVASEDLMSGVIKLTVVTDSNTPFIRIQHLTEELKTISSLKSIE